MGKVVTIEFETEEDAQKFYNIWHIDLRDQQANGMKSMELDWHTSHELYEHRYTLFRALVFSTPHRFRAWRSRLHSDGTMFEDSFIVGINLITSMSRTRNDITYHLPNSWWDKFEGLTTYDKAPEWDGASPKEGLRRLDTHVDRMQKGATRGAY